jgi:ABC-type transport system involved in cytochrome c biogenesis permease subunit
LSAAAALGVVGAVAGVHTSGTPRFSGALLAAVSGAALLLRARWHTDRSQVVALVTGGIATLTVALAAAALTAPQHLPWLCASAAVLAGAALYLGVAAPVLSPVTHRGIELLEYPVLAAVVPVACWVCGCYGAVRGLSLT